jgi:hypothetical protein
LGSEVLRGMLVTRVTDINLSLGRDVCVRGGMPVVAESFIYHEPRRALPSSVVSDFDLQPSHLFRFVLPRGFPGFSPAIEVFRPRLVSGVSYLPTQTF